MASFTASTAPMASFIASNDPTATSTAALPSDSPNTAPRATIAALDVANAPLPSGAAIALEFAKFQAGWLANRKSSCNALRCKAISARNDSVNSGKFVQAPVADPALVCKLLKEVRVALDPILPQGPMFIITDYKTAKSDAAKGSYGLTTWGATFVGRPCQSTKEWWHEPTCPATTKKNRVAMFLYAKYCNSDWVIAPILALLLRELLPWLPTAAVEPVEPLEGTHAVNNTDALTAAAEAAEEAEEAEEALLDASSVTQAAYAASQLVSMPELAAAVDTSHVAAAQVEVGVVEFPADPTLPVYQFLDDHGGKQFMRSKTAEVFNCISLITTSNGNETGARAKHVRLVDIVRGFEVADPDMSHHKLQVVDVDVCMFLLFRNAKLRRLTREFDTAVDECQRRVMALLQSSQTGTAP